MPAKEGHTVEPPTRELAPDEDEERNGDSPFTPSSVFEGLREAYAEPGEERRITIQIAPGRFGGNLAARYKPGPWSDYRKRAERVLRQGGGEEAELQFAASTMVQCCETILFRPTDNSELIPMAEANPVWRGEAPVVFDHRLAEAVGIEPVPGSQTAICRLVFKNPAALQDHFITLDAWLKEAIASDDEDEDAERPT